jgi:hypothetical protein
MNGPPSPANDYWAEYLTLLRRAFREWTGRELLDGAGSPAQWAEPGRLIADLIDTIAQPSRLSNSSVSTRSEFHTRLRSLTPI